MRGRTVVTVYLALPTYTIRYTSHHSTRTRPKDEQADTASHPNHRHRLLTQDDPPLLHRRQQYALPNPPNNPFIPNHQRPELIPRKALSLRSSSTASMLPKPRRVIATRSSGWDKPRISPQQRIVMQHLDKQARRSRMMQRVFGHRLVPGFLR